MASSSLILPSPSWSYGPLHEACIFGDLEKLKKCLTTTDARVDARVEIGDKKRTPLHFAAEYGRMSIVTYLLSSYGASASLVLKKDSEGNTPLHLATGNLDILRQLLRVLPPSSDVTTVPLNGKKQTLLHYAAAEGNADVVKFLLERRAVKDARDNDNAIPFHFAARCGSVSVMELLVNEHDIDATNKKGKTALHYASSKGKMEAVAWLLQKGASVSKVDKEKKNNALHRAIISGSSEVIPILIDAANTDDLFAINSQGQTPVGIAHDTKKDAAAVVKCVCSRLSHGTRERASYISIHSAKHSDGATLLHYAAGYATGKELQSLILQMNTGTLTRREIVNSKDSKGNNLFHWAAMIGNHDVIKTLQDYEVDPLERNQDGRRPLCTALIDDHLEFARKLIQCLGQKLDLVKWQEDIWMSIGLEHMDYRDPILLHVLYKEKVETAKFILKNTPWKGHFVNELTAALHEDKKIVYTLCNTDEFKEVLVAENREHQMHIQACIKEVAENREHQMHIQACNLIAVCASILSGGSFQVLLDLPDESSLYYRIFLTMSFCCSIITVLTVAHGLLPRFLASHSVVEETATIGRSLFWAIVLLGASLLTGSVALASAFPNFVERMTIGLIAEFVLVSFGTYLLSRTSLTYRNKRVSSVLMRVGCGFFLFCWIIVIIILFKK